MITEDRKFLDLDHVCDKILAPEDRAMFDEAIRCYQIGSHRAAVILAWCVTAECLYRRIDELALEGDGVAQRAWRELQDIKGGVHFEENLITQAKNCELVDEYEEKCLRFARDVRSKCAHPTGVVPSAEAVRNILHICSQTVLCRDGYRGMAFIQHFVDTKLDDIHLFSNRNLIQETCRFYISKVPERIRSQFLSCAIDHIRNGVTIQWKSNVLIFLRQLLKDSPDELALKIVQKLGPIETLDPTLYAILIGIDERESLWDEHVRHQVKSFLREKLKTGKVDKFEFISYANICVLIGLDIDDIALIKLRFAVFAEHLSRHELLLEKLDEELITSILEGLSDIATRDSMLKGLPEIISSELFNEGTSNVHIFIDTLIQENWRDEGVNAILQRGSNWSTTLKVAFLEKSEQYLFQCSEDYPDDILVVFEIADALLSSTPALLPNVFEKTIKKIVEEEPHPSWYDVRGEVFDNFIGQVDLIRTRYTSFLPEIQSLVLPLRKPEDE